MLVFNPKHINSNGVDKYNNNLDITDIHLYRELVSWKLWYTTINVILTNRPTNTFVWNFSGKNTSGTYWAGGQHTPTIQPINGQMLKVTSKRVDGNSLIGMTIKKDGKRTFSISLGEETTTKSS